jgi:hypothetical protein
MSQVPETPIAGRLDRPEPLAVLREKKNEQNGISDIAISVTHNMDNGKVAVAELGE